MKKAKLYKKARKLSADITKSLGDLVGQRLIQMAIQKLSREKLNQQRIKLMLMHKIWSIRLIIVIS